MRSGCGSGLSASRSCAPVWPRAWRSRAPGSCSERRGTSSRSEPCRWNVSASCGATGHSWAVRARRRFAAAAKRRRARRGSRRCHLLHPPLRRAAPPRRGARAGAGLPLEQGARRPHPAGVGAGSHALARRPLEAIVPAAWSVSARSSERRTTMCGPGPEPESSRRAARGALGASEFGRELVELTALVAVRALRVHAGRASPAPVPTPPAPSRLTRSYSLAAAASRSAQATYTEYAMRALLRDASDQAR
jgi:hypothetical protein